MSRLALPVGARAVYAWAPPGDPSAPPWTLYELPLAPDASPLWRQFKLMQPTSVPAAWGRRRSYVLTWSPLALRLRKDRDRYALERGFPDLYERVELALTLSYGPDWLRGVCGLSDATIAEEKAKLLEASRSRSRKRKQRPPLAPTTTT